MLNKEENHMIAISEATLVLDWFFGIMSLFSSVKQETSGCRTIEYKNDCHYIN